MLAGAALAAGCSADSAAPHRATASTCYAFGVRALKRHVTVHAVPRACAGLSHEQVNLAVAARAVRDVAGSRPRAAARRLAYQDGGYLAQLIAAVPAGPARTRLPRRGGRRRAPGGGAGRSASPR